MQSMYSTALPWEVEYIDCISAEHKTLAPSECPEYDIKPSNCKAPALKLWGMWSTPSSLLLPGPL